MLHNIERTCPHKSFVLLNNSIYNMYMGLEEMKPGICNSNPLMSQDHIICINQSVAIQLSEGNNLHFVHSSSIRRSFGQSLHNILKASVQHKLGTNQPSSEKANTPPSMSSLSPSSSDFSLSQGLLLLSTSVTTSVVSRQSLKGDAL